MSYELIPDFPNVPPETWEGVDVKWVVDFLIERTGIPEEELPSGTGLLDLVRLAKTPEIPQEERERLLRSRPDLLASIDASRERQIRERGH